LNDIPIDALIALMACVPPEANTRRYVSRYITELQETIPEISGKDLKAMGYPPSPEYRKMLDALLYARLDGKIKTREDEVEFLDKHFNKDIVDTIGK
jgi:tRNA nucleotidyltransferase (CCA-adding enzyme)